MAKSLDSAGAAIAPGEVVSGWDNWAVRADGCHAGKLCGALTRRISQNVQPGRTSSGRARVCRWAFLTYSGIIIGRHPRATSVYFRFAFHRNLLMQLRLGIIGLGPSWQSRYRPALRALADRFEIRAVCEPVAHRALAVAEQEQAVAVDGFRALTARDDVDAMLFLSSQWYGELPILAACQARKAIYCAAALDLSADDVAALHQRIDSSGVAFTAELPCRVAPATVRLKELIATRLGPVRLIVCNRRLGWQSNDGDARDVTGDLIEQVDWCRYVVGNEPVAVSSNIQLSGTPQTQDYEIISLAFAADSTGEASPDAASSVQTDPVQTNTAASGAVAQLHCGSIIANDWQDAAGFRVPAVAQVVCQRGVAYLDLPTGLTWFDEAGRHREDLDTERPVDEQLLLNFYRSVTSLLRSTSSLDDACRALQAVQLARESYTQSRRLTINHPPPSGDCSQ